MIILGLDNGYNFTKTSKGICIPSTIKKGIDDINSVIQVAIGDNDYVVGNEDGAYVADADKLKNEETRELVKVCSLTSIGLSYPTSPFIEVNLVVGVPIGYYSNQKEEFKNLFKGMNETIKINKVGIKQTIKIKDVLVYPQSAGIIFKYSNSTKNQSTLVIDIGGGTWDVSQFNGLILEKKATYQDGMLQLYSKIAQFLNSNYYTQYEDRHIYNLIDRGYFTAGPDKHSIEVVEPIIREHIQSMFNKLKRDFTITSVDNKYLIGGGAKELCKYIEEELPGIEPEENAQFANAECFELMGKMKFKK